MGARLLMVHLKDFMLSAFLHLGERAAMGAAVGALLTPVVAPAALGLIGFSAVGPVAGKFTPPTC